jgi:hypothetical protein
MLYAGVLCFRLSKRSLIVEAGQRKTEALRNSSSRSKCGKISASECLVGHSNKETRPQMLDTKLWKRSVVICSHVMALTKAFSHTWRLRGAGPKVNGLQGGVLAHEFTYSFKSEDTSSSERDILLRLRWDLNDMPTFQDRSREACR